ncbi:hypothetical protein PENANT_c010G02631 [Penicillium antarcticum]|uniref:Uncharacterized protein n=1 Tax=Penicillium antarcticum TaxID=416450 RepID=A0A1V6Q9D3_9EURO|nr:hypothetical protein PENANT_c010G02631 [Penicillium antarcticum]
MACVSPANSAAIGPFIDGKLLKEGWTYKDNVANTRCKEIIQGDTNIEAIILDGLLKRLHQERFNELVDNALASQIAKELLLMGNTIFIYSQVGISEALHDSVLWRDRVYMYHWEQPSSFPELTCGLSYRGLCAMLLRLNKFQNCPPSTQQVSLEAAGIRSAFAHGQQPWEPYLDAKRLM